MEYKQIGKTGQQFSVLSFGCMRFSDDDTAAAAVKKAIELDVNYFDVAPAYCGGASERRLGLGLKGCDRSNLIITAKSSPGNGGDGIGENYSPETGFGIRSADQARKQIERSMEIIGVDHLDVYHLWACHGPAVFEEAMKPGGFMEGVIKAKSEGLFDHIGWTGHMDADGIIKILKEFEFDMVTIPFHLRDTSRRKAIEYCAERGIGVIAMNPLAGGGLAQPLPVLKSIAASLGFESMTEAALRYLASYPGITTVLNGITIADHAIEGASAISKGEISADTMALLETRVNELYANVKHFCSACGYCGECPEGILIPKVLDIYANLQIPSLADLALADLSEKLAAGPVGYDPSLCVACKSCESKCPNSLPISNMMSDAAVNWPKV